jgi:hypothetical protein
MQATLLLFAVKPLGLCGEPLDAAPRVQVFGRPIKAPIKADTKRWRPSDWYT